MNRDSAEAHEVRATGDGFGRPEAKPADDRINGADPADAEIIDPDAVIIAEPPATAGPPESEVRARTAEPAPSSAADEMSRDTDEHEPVGADEHQPGGADEHEPGDTDEPMPRDTYEPMPGGAEQPMPRDADEPVPGGADERPVEDTSEDMPVIMAERAPASAAGGQHASARTELAGEAQLMRERWVAIQTSFVDDPRASVAAAADLVAEAISTLVSTARERERGLRAAWDRDGVDTEGLRHVLRDYRGFLDRLAAL